LSNAVIDLTLFIILLVSALLIRKELLRLKQDLALPVFKLDDSSNFSL